MHFYLHLDESKSSLCVAVYMCLFSDSRFVNLTRSHFSSLITCDCNALLVRKSNSMGQPCFSLFGYLIGFLFSFWAALYTVYRLSECHQGVGLMLWCFTVRRRLS